MHTWSLEETVIRAQSALAVVVQGVWDRFTNRPTYANDHPILGCPNASDCRNHGCAGDCSEAIEYETSADVPRNGPAEHPAGGLTHSPESPQPAPQLDWHGWAEPAVMEVLSGHYPIRLIGDGDPQWRCSCAPVGLWDLQAWREHVAPIIASRLACDPARAIAALHNHKPK